MDFSLNPLTNTPYKWLSKIQSINKEINAI